MLFARILHTYPGTGLLFVSSPGPRHWALLQPFVHFSRTMKLNIALKIHQKAVTKDKHQARDFWHDLW